MWVGAYTCRYNRQQWMGICYLKVGGGGGWTGEGWKSSPDYDISYLRHHTTRYALSGVTVRQIAAPRGAVVGNIT